MTDLIARLEQEADEQLLACAAESEDDSVFALIALLREAASALQGQTWQPMETVLKGEPILLTFRKGNLEYQVCAGIIGLSGRARSIPGSWENPAIAWMPLPLPAPPKERP